MTLSKLPTSLHISVQINNTAGLVHAPTNLCSILRGGGGGEEGREIEGRDITEGIADAASSIYSFNLWLPNTCSCRQNRGPALLKLIFKPRRPRQSAAGSCGQGGPIRAVRESPFEHLVSELGHEVAAARLGDGCLAAETGRRAKVLKGSDLPPPVPARPCLQPASSRSRPPSLPGCQGLHSDGLSGHRR